MQGGNAAPAAAEGLNALQELSIAAGRAGQGGRRWRRVSAFLSFGGCGPDHPAWPQDGTQAPDTWRWVRPPAGSFRDSCWEPGSAQWGRCLWDVPVPDSHAPFRTDGRHIQCWRSTLRAPPGAREGGQPWPDSGSSWLAWRMPLGPHWSAVAQRGPVVACPSAVAGGGGLRGSRPGGFPLGSMCLPLPWSAFPDPGAFCGHHRCLFPGIPGVLGALGCSWGAEAACAWD